MNVWSTFTYKSEIQKKKKKSTKNVKNKSLWKKKKLKKGKPMSLVLTSSKSLSLFIVFLQFQTNCQVGFTFDESTLRA